MQTSDGGHDLRFVFFPPRCQGHGVSKSQKKSHSTLQNWRQRSNSVTRQVILIGQKLVKMSKLKKSNETFLVIFKQCVKGNNLPGKQWYSTMLPMFVVWFVKKILPFSISKGCPQSTSIQLGGHEDQEPEERHSISSSPFRLKPSSHLKVARPPIRRVVKIMVELAGWTRGLHSVSAQVGASGSHLPEVSHRRRSKPGNEDNWVIS